jgi:protein TonB
MGVANSLTEAPARRVPEAHPIASSEESKPVDLTQQEEPADRFAGIAVVVTLHAVLGYLLISGLAHKAVELLKKPLEVSLIEELKLEPPPPQKLPPPPKVAVPPPAYVPPPEVTVQAPIQQNAIVAITSTPASPVEVAPPAIAAPPQPVAVSLVCSNFAEVRGRLSYPPQAQRMGLSGDVLVEFTVRASGEISDIHVARSTHTAFNAAAADAVAQLRCTGQGRPVNVRAPFAFRLDR